MVTPETLLFLILKHTGELLPLLKIITLCEYMQQKSQDQHYNVRSLRVQSIITSCFAQVHHKKITFAQETDIRLLFDTGCQSNDIQGAPTETI